MIYLKWTIRIIFNSLLAKNNMIKTAGEIVSPKEIENILYEIDDIIEAGVVGVPDEILGQAITAVVALKEDSKLTKEEIILYCSKNLEKFMVPRYIEIRKQLPKTSTGKLDLKNLAKPKYMNLCVKCKR